MSASKHLVAAAAVVSIFGAGVLAGRWMGSGPTVVPPAPTFAPTAQGSAPVEERWSGATLEEYQRRLKLSSVQVETIRPIIVATSQKMTQMRRTLKTDLHDTVKKMNERVSGELTVEQRREFVALIREKLALRDAVK